MRRIALCLLTLLVLSGCSSTFTYRNLDWLVHWFIDDYIELTDQQEQVFDGHMKQWLAWHKSVELPRYRAHLETLREQVANGDMTQQQWLSHFEQGRAHWIRLRDHLSPELAVMAESLSDEQVTSLFKAIEKDINEDDEKDEESKSDAELLEERKERMQDNLKDYIGRLTDKQKQLIEHYAPMFVNSNYWPDYQRRVTQAARELFEQRQTDPEFSNKLAVLMMNPDIYKIAEHEQVAEQNRRTSAAFLAEALSSTTAKQKRKMLSKIDDLIEDVTDLQED